MIARLTAIYRNRAITQRRSVASMPKPESEPPPDSFDFADATFAFPGQKWDESHEKRKPRWLGGKIEGLAHTRCNRLWNNQHDTPRFHKSNRQRQKHIGAFRSRTPLPGGRDDPRRKTMRGEVVSRATGERWGARR